MATMARVARPRPARWAGLNRSCGMTRASRTVTPGLRESDEQDAERHARGQAVEQSRAQLAAHRAAGGDEHDRGQGDQHAGGLIFGYATVSERAIAEGIGRLAAVIGDL
jgi:hypothetical protein